MKAMGNNGLGGELKPSAEQIARKKDSIKF
jgi:hypothetical protein